MKPSRTHAHGGAERRFLPGSLYINVVALIVSSQVRKLVDHLLRHGQPIANANFLPNQGPQFRQPV